MVGCHKVLYVLFKNGGSNLCSVDDSNDHVLSVWDWQREEKLADVKVFCDKIFRVTFDTCGRCHKMLITFILQSDNL